MADSGKALLPPHLVTISGVINSAEINQFFKTQNRRVSKHRHRVNIIFHTDINGEFTKRELDAQTAPMYAQMLVGLVALAGQWWMDTREEQQLDKPVVAAHLVNLAWYGMRNLRPNPTLYVRERAERDS